MSRRVSEPTPSCDPNAPASLMTIRQELASRIMAGVLTEAPNCTNWLKYGREASLYAVEMADALIVALNGGDPRKQEEKK